MFINIKNLTGKIDKVEIKETDPFWRLQLIYSSQSKIPFDQLKFIYNGISLLTFDTFFQSLKNLNITENETIHCILRLGGPQPQERAVFNYFYKILQAQEVMNIERLITLFSTDKISIECPVCLEYGVNRVLSCGEHGICFDCFNSLPEKRCPVCREFPVNIL